MRSPENKEHPFAPETDVYQQQQQLKSDADQPKPDPMAVNDHQQQDSKSAGDPVDGAEAARSPIRDVAPDRADSAVTDDPIDGAEATGNEAKDENHDQSESDSSRG